MESIVIFLILFLPMGVMMWGLVLTCLYCLYRWLKDEVS